MTVFYKRIIKLFGTYSFGNVVQSALSILLVPLYTSILSPKDYGILALMTLTVSLITRAVSATINHAFIRFYHNPEYQSQNGLLLFNLFLMILMAAIITPAFFIFTDAPVKNIMLFVLVEMLGIIGLCAATTIIAAIISRTSIKGPLFSVLSFPILIILLLLLVKASSTILDGGSLGAVSTEIQGLVAYAVVMLTASLMLFKFVWLE